MTDDLGLSVTIDARMERFEASMERAARLVEDVTRRIDAATARSADALARLDAAAAPAARALAQMEQATAPATRALAQIDPAIQAATGGMSRFAAAAEVVRRSIAAMDTQVLTADRAWTALELTVGTAQGGLRGLRRELAENVVEASLFGDAADQASSAWTRLEIVAGAVGVGLSARGLLEQAQEYHQAVSLIERAAGEQAGYVERQLYDIAQAAGASFTEMVTLAKSLEDLPGGMREATQVVEAVARSMATMPGSAQASAAAITQFTQAMQLGVLRGQDFKSVMSQAPGLAEALADGLEVTQGELRALAEAGELSAERVSAALRSVLPDLTALNEQIGLSLSQQIQGVDNALGRFAGAVDARAGSSAAIGSTLGDVTERLESIEAQNAAVAVMDRFAVAGGMASDAMMFLADNIGLVIGAWAAWSAMKAVGGAVLFRGALTTAGTAMSALGISTQTTLGRIGQFTAAATFSVSPLSIIVGLLSAGAAGWFLWESRVTDAQRATEAYHEAMASLDDMLSKHGGTLETLADKYATVEEAQRGTLTKEVLDEIDDITRKMAAAFDALSGGFHDARVKAIDAWRSDGSLGQNLGAELDQVLSMFRETGDIDAYNESLDHLVDKLSEVGGFYGRQAAEALGEASVSTIGTARQVEGLNDEIEDLNSLLAYMQGEISHPEFLQRLADGAETAASAALALEQQIWALKAAAEALAGVNAETMLFHGIEKEIANLERLTAAYNSGSEAAVDAEIRRQAVEKESGRILGDLVKLRGILAEDEASYAIAAAEAAAEAETLVAARWDNKAGADAYREALSKLHQGQKDNNQALDAATRLLDEYAKRSMPAAMQAEQRYTAVIDEAIASGRVQIDVINALIAARDEHVGAIQAEADAELARLTDAPGLIEEETAAILAGGDALERLNEAREIATASADQYTAVLEAAREAGLSETEAIQLATKSADALAQAMADQDIAKGLNRQREGVLREAERLGMDISGSLVDMIHDGLDEGVDGLVDVFDGLMRSIQAQMINQTLVMPITTAMVGAAPGLFGVQSSGVPAGYQVAQNQGGQTVIVPPGQAPPQDYTAAVSSAAAGLMPTPSWLSGELFTLDVGWDPFGLATPVEPGFIGLDGATFAADGSWVAGQGTGVPISAGTMIGAGMFGLNAGLGFASGDYIGGATNLVAAGMMFTPLAPVAPFVPLVGSIFGGLFGGEVIPSVAADFRVGGGEFSSFGVQSTAWNDPAGYAASAEGVFGPSVSHTSSVLSGYGLEPSLALSLAEKEGQTSVHWAYGDEYDFQHVGDMAEASLVAVEKLLEVAAKDARDLGQTDDARYIQRVLETHEAASGDELAAYFDHAVSFAETFDQAIETMSTGVVDFAESARGQMVDSLKMSQESIEDFADTTADLLPGRVDEATEALKTASLAMFGLTEESQILAPEIQSFIGQMQGLQDEFKSTLEAAGWTEDTIGEAGFASLAEAEAEAIRRSIEDWLETVVLTQKGADALEEAFGDIPGILDLLTAEVEQNREDLQRAYDQRYANATGDASWLGVPQLMDDYQAALDEAASLGLDATVVTRTFTAEIAAAADGLDKISLFALLEEFADFEVMVDGLTLALWRADAAARQAAQALEADWRARLIQATHGGTLEGQLDLFDRQAQQEYIDAASNGYADLALLEETLAAERLAIIEQFGEQSVAALEAMVNAAQSAGQNVRTYLNELMGEGGADGLSPLDAYEASSDLFSSALGAIASGQTQLDAYALSQITTLAQQMLEASEAYHGQTGAYGADRAFVIGALDALADTLGVPEFDPDADTAALLAQVRDAAGITAPSTIADEISAHFTDIFGGVGAESYLGQLARASDEAAALSAEIAGNTADTAMTADEIRALIDAAGNEDWLDDRQWSAPGFEQHAAANHALAQATGYAGDFGGGGFSAWIAGQDRATQMEAAQILLNHGQSNRIGWAGAAPNVNPNGVLEPYQAANNVLRAAVGYIADFGGGGFDAWIIEQDEATKALARSVLYAFDQPERVGFAAGGWVHGPGGPMDDLIPARLSAGEFVINAASAQRWAPALEAINDNRLPALAVPAAPRGIDFAPVTGLLRDLIEENRRQTARIEQLEQVLVAHGLQLEEAVRDGYPAARRSEKHLKKIAQAAA